MFFLPMLPIFFVPLLSGFSSGGSFPKPLAKEKEQQLLLHLRDGTDAEKESAKQTLILHNLRLVAHIAKKYNNAQRESEELISIGIVGLIKAILSYDSEKSIRLATYASLAVLKMLSSHGCVSMASKSIPSEQKRTKMAYFDAGIREYVYTLLHFGRLRKVCTYVYP